MSSFPYRLKECRISKKLTQKQMATVCQVNERSYQNYESGDRIPNLDVLIKIADFLEISLDYLVGHNSDTSSSSHFKVEVNGATHSVGLGVGNQNIINNHQRTKKTLPLMAEAIDALYDIPPHEITPMRALLESGLKILDEKIKK